MCRQRQYHQLYNPTDEDVEAVATISARLIIKKINFEQETLSNEMCLF